MEHEKELYETPQLTRKLEVDIERFNRKLDMSEQNIGGNSQKRNFELLGVPYSAKNLKDVKHHPTKISVIPKDKGP